MGKVKLRDAYQVDVLLFPRMKGVRRERISQRIVSRNFFLLWSNQFEAKAVGMEIEFLKSVRQNCWYVLTLIEG